ncbi:MAG: Ig-like domain-containing protein [Promethearchaeota archaeon]
MIKNEFKYIHKRTGKILFCLVIIGIMCFSVVPLNSLNANLASQTEVSGLNTSSTYYYRDNYINGLSPAPISSLLLESSVGIPGLGESRPYGWSQYNDGIVSFSQAGAVDWVISRDVHCFDSKWYLYKGLEILDITIKLSAAFGGYLGWSQLYIINHIRNSVVKLLDLQADSLEHYYELSLASLVGGNLAEYISPSNTIDFYFRSCSNGYWYWSWIFPLWANAWHFLSIDLFDVKVQYRGIEDYNAPTVDITGDLVNLDAVRGVVPISAAASDNIGVSLVEFYIDNNLIGSDYDAPYSYQWDSRSVSEGKHSVKVISYDTSGNRGIDGCEITVDNIAEKIAIFFWTSEYGDGMINSFITDITRRGYTKFFLFKDFKHIKQINNLKPAFEYVDAYEGENDIIFLYIWGHGEEINIPYYSHTLLYYDPEAIVKYYTPSWHVRDCMDILEANRKCVLVESCGAGHYIDDFNVAPYLVMTSTDYETLALGLYDGAVPLFSREFFYNIGTRRDNAIGAFYRAASTCGQNSQIAVNSDYIFFPIN